MRHRPIGIGVQGLADTFILLGMPFDSTEVNFSNLKMWLFQSIYTSLKCDAMIFSGSAIEQGYF